MKVVIAAVSSDTQISGVTRHASNLARCLLTRSEITHVHLVGATWQHQIYCDAVSKTNAKLHIHSVPLAVGALARSFWYYKDLPAIAAQLDADVVHFAYPAPFHRRAFHCPTVVSLHDLYPYDAPPNFGFLELIFNRRILWQCLRAVDAIAAVSDHTLQQLAARAPVSILTKAARIYNCVEGVLTQSPLSGWRGAPFFFCVARHRWNKNIPLTIRVFQRLLQDQKIDPESELLIVGATGPETRRIRRQLRTAGLSQKVTLVSGIRDAEMQWCYKNCELLLAPSTVEGFGLSVAEAMLAGCRIVCSDIGALRELEDASCHYVPLTTNAEKDFAETVFKALAEPRNQPAKLPQLSLSVIAEQYAQLYSKLVCRRSSGSTSIAV